MALDLEVAGTVRELTEDERPPASEVSYVAKLRDSHHALARALARGQTPIQASQATGYRVSRIYLLLRDPTFNDLVTYYKTDDEEARADIEARFAGMTVDFMQELHERLSTTRSPSSQSFSTTLSRPLPTALATLRSRGRRT
jgi:hypothetical protein